MNLDEKIKKMIINASEYRHSEGKAGLWVWIDPSDLPSPIKQIKDLCFAHERKRILEELKELKRTHQKLYSSEDILFNDICKLLEGK